MRPDKAKCIHYYFYFIDEALGLCFLRVPSVKLKHLVVIPELARAMAA
jgi:hypothetical protein